MKALQVIFLCLLCSGYVFLPWIHYGRYKASFFERLSMSAGLLLPLGMASAFLSLLFFLLLNPILPTMADRIFEIFFPIFPWMAIAVIVLKRKAAKNHAA